MKGHQALKMLIYDLDQKRLSRGGLVSGGGTATSDSVPSDLSAGEFVLTAAATRMIGVERLDAANAAAALADGGMNIPSGPDRFSFKKDGLFGEGTAEFLGHNQMIIYTDTVLRVGGKFGMVYPSDAGEMRIEGRILKIIQDGPRRGAIVAITHQEFVPAPEAVTQALDLAFRETRFKLNEGELQVIDGRLQGWSGKKIADKFGMTKDIVRHHAQNYNTKIENVDPSALPENSRTGLNLFAQSVAGRDLRKAAKAATGRWEAKHNGRAAS